MADSRWFKAAAAALAIAAALLVTGCEAQTEEPEAEAVPEVVGVRGTGVALTKPDRADVTFALTRRAGKADNAMKEGGTASQKLVKALKDAGIADEDMQTTGVMLNAEYDWSKGQKLKGFTADVSVRVTVHKLDDVGKLMSIATSAGADRVEGPVFEMSEENPAKYDAIEKAVADAKRRAEAMAKAAGRKVGRVRFMSEPDVQVTPDYMLGRAQHGVGLSYGGWGDTWAYSPEIKTGQLESKAVLDIVYDLE